jgi:hypothetical protein
MGIAGSRVWGVGDDEMGERTSVWRRRSGKFVLFSRAHRGVRLWDAHYLKSAKKKTDVLQSVTYTLRLVTYTLHLF